MVGIDCEHSLFSNEVRNAPEPLIERAFETAEFLEKAACRASFPFPEAPLIRSLIQQLAETLAETNEALAACQSQSRGRIRELASLGYELANLLEGVSQVNLKSPEDQQKLRVAGRLAADVFGEELAKIGGTFP